MKLGGNRTQGDNPLFFSISGTGSFLCPVAQTRRDKPCKGAVNYLCSTYLSNIGIMNSPLKLYVLVFSPVIYSDGDNDNDDDDDDDDDDDGDDGDDDGDGDGDDDDDDALGSLCETCLGYSGPIG